MAASTERKWPNGSDPEGSTSVAPCVRAEKSSWMLPSNATDMTWAMRRPGAANKRTSSDDWNATRPACVHKTPLGVPVDPDVKHTYAGAWGWATRRWCWRASNSGIVPSPSPPSRTLCTVKDVGQASGTILNWHGLAVIKVRAPDRPKMRSRTSWGTAGSMEQ
jgi:hypothetical protein